MAPSERIQLFRWQFVPIEDERDHSVRWKWQAYTQSGALALECRNAFDTLTECIDDAKSNGYGGR